MADNFVMPGVILSIDSVEHKSVVDNNRSKVSFSLAIVESFPILSDLVEEVLPESNIISQLFINFFRVNHPK